MQIDSRGARARALGAAVALVAALGACEANTSFSEEGPFADAAQPATYVPKVKTLLTGLPATDGEVAAVNADPAALPRLIDEWMARPEFELRMRDFFRNAFQQNNVTLGAISSSLNIPDFYLPDEERLEYALMDSFPRTAWQLVQEGRPFTETVTTRRYMMTTAMMAALSYADMFAVDDANRRVERLAQVSALRLVMDPLDNTSAAASAAQFAPGKSGDWTWAIPVQNLTPACRAEIEAGRQTNPGFMRLTRRNDATQALFQLVFGGVDFWDFSQADRAAAPSCNRQGGNNLWTGLVMDDGTVNDWEDWRMVTVETIPISETETLPSPVFWDLPALRAATTLRLKTPRVGFLGTLAWNGNWPTNESNQARVTANQALIVALGLSIIPAGAIAPAPKNASDTRHSENPACASCHNVLDPLRQFFRQSYSFAYHEQRDLAQYMSDATFMVGGVTRTGRGVEDLAAILASHPHFAIGWAQKLQLWANSTAADESDPELQRIAVMFQLGRFDFRGLVREVFSSPLVTLSKGTRTYRDGVTIGIARRDQLCAALSARLGLEDACHQRIDPGAVVNGVSRMIATDSYYRAAELPSIPRNPDLFFRNSVEAICAELAGGVAGGGTGHRFSTANVTAAIADMVSTVMGLPPSDRRAGPAATILSEHFAAARTAGADAGAALRSTFVLACISPSSVLVGL